MALFAYLATRVVARYGFRHDVTDGLRNTMATQTIERPVGRADLQARFPGRYLSLTSFKRDGTGVATPLWFVSDGERLFALTDLHSAKVARIRQDPRVLVAPCRANGKLRSEPLLPAQRC